MSRCDVLIIGAGPTGLVLALWLTKLGATVRIIDKTAEPGTTSRALAIHARTLELYAQLDLAETVIQHGHKVPAVALWTGGKRKARVSFEDAGATVTPYPFLHIYPQDEHENLLVERLAALGVTVERQCELLSYHDDITGITAQLRLADGEQQQCVARYIAGCDGARSTVRQIMDTGFPGGTYKQVFYVADVVASSPSINGDLAVDLDEADFLAIFPLANTKEANVGPTGADMPATGRARLIGTVRDARAERADTLSFTDISTRAIENLNLTIEKVNWFSTYHVHHRVTEHFRKGRAFLLGDAAHIHSPAGGQGMNTGIGDAINLAWKLKTVLDGRANDALLDTYEAERKPFAKTLVETTDRAFTLATAEGTFADFIRMHIVPAILPAAAKFASWRKWMFRTVSQTRISYRDSLLSNGAVGAVHGGDRLPWVRIDGIDNYKSLSKITWQLHIYGTASDALIAWCSENHLPLHVFAWQREFATAGLKQNALYLLRPDSYLAQATLSAEPAILAQYFHDRAIRLRAAK